MREQAESTASLMNDPMKYAVPSAGPYTISSMAPAFFSRPKRKTEPMASTRKTGAKETDKDRQEGALGEKPLDEYRPESAREGAGRECPEPAETGVEAAGIHRAREIRAQQPPDDQAHGERHVQPGGEERFHQLRARDHARRVHAVAHHRPSCGASAATVSCVIVMKASSSDGDFTSMRRGTSPRRMRSSEIAFL